MLTCTHVLRLVSFLLLTHGERINGLGRKNHSITISALPPSSSMNLRGTSAVPHISKINTLPWKPIGIQCISTPYGYNVVLFQYWLVFYYQTFPNCPYEPGNGMVQI